ncbi:MAG: MFS transporter [Dehalococcoidia bacterium]|nr:MFS transporter [Dehalococcoidia bacterium]
MTVSAERGAPVGQRLYTSSFVLLFLMEFTIFVTFYMLLPTVPLYIKELGGTNSTVGLVIGIAGPIAAFGVPLYGLGVDRWSRKGMAVLGLAINVVGALIMIIVVSPLTMLIPTILRRVGSGATGAATRTLILDIAPPSRRGEAMTNFATSHNIAIAFGPAVGLWIYHGFGSTELFLACAALMAGATLFLFPIRVRPQVGGEGTERRSSSDVAPQGRQDAPRRETWVDKLIVREAVMPGITVLLLSAAYLSTTTFVSILGEEREVPNYEWFFVLYAVVVISGRLLTGRVSDTYGRAIILLPSLALTVGCMVTLAFTHSTIGFLAAAFMLGLGFGTGQPMLQAVAADWTPPEKYGRAMAMMMGGFSFGSAAGTVFVGEMSERLDFAAAFLGLAMAAGVALVIAWWGFRRRRIPLLITPERGAM